MSLSLERLQAEFAAALTTAGRAPEFASALLERDTHALERMALYRANMIGAWQQALAAAYPVVRTLLGAEFFGELARAYGQTHPGTSGDLNLFGARFGEFVATFRHTQGLPYLADVAALEWAVHRAHYAADAEPLRRERIAALQSDELLAARFVLHPACTWLASPHPITTIWLAHQPRSDVELPETLDERQFAFVVRPRWRVEVLSATAGEIVALDALRAGASMDDTIAAALRADHDFDFARAFLRWLDHNVFVGIEEACALLDPQVRAAAR
jgi:hypothetical protein